jgi:hypothetical protein
VVVVGVVVEVAPAPWPEAPVVPGLPLALGSAAAPLLFQLCVPVWVLPVLPVLPIELVSAVPVDAVPLDAEPLAVEPVDELLLMSLPLMPVELHAASDSAITLPMKMP